MRNRLSFHDWQKLSNYIDGQLTPKQKSELDTRLKHDSDLAEALESIRQTRNLLRLAPKRHAPRNFTLTPEMVGRRDPWKQLFPIFSFSSAVAGIIFLILLSLEFLPLFASGKSASMVSMDQREEAPMQEAAVLAADEIQETREPIIILWGYAGTGGGGGETQMYAEPLGLGGGGEGMEAPSQSMPRPEVPVEPEGEASDIASDSVSEEPMQKEMLEAPADSSAAEAETQDNVTAKEEPATNAAADTAAELEPGASEIDPILGIQPTQVKTPTPTAPQDNMKFYSMIRTNIYKIAIGLSAGVTFISAMIAWFLWRSGRK